MYFEPSNPISDGEDSITAHVDTKSQNAPCACPFKRHEEVFPPSCTKYIASISFLVITSKNSAWLQISITSFGDGVAVHANLYGVYLNWSIIFCFVAP